MSDNRAPPFAEEDLRKRVFGGTHVLRSLLRRWYFPCLGMVLESVGTDVECRCGMGSSWRTRVVMEALERWITSF